MGRNELLKIMATGVAKTKVWGTHPRICEMQEAQAELLLPEMEAALAALEEAGYEIKKKVEIISVDEAPINSNFRHYVASTPAAYCRP